MTVKKYIADYVSRDQDQGLVQAVAQNFSGCLHAVLDISFVISVKLVAQG
jgi:hypothetical protein